jgi:hypothetical protein
MIYCHMRSKQLGNSTSFVRKHLFLIADHPCWPFQLHILNLHCKHMNRGIQSGEDV